MSNYGIECSICTKKAVECKVTLIHRSRTVQEFGSALAAENYALDKDIFPSIIKFVYVCKGCGYEDTKLERLLTDPYD